MSLLRRAAPLLLAAVLLSGCSGDDPSTIVAPTTTVGAGPPTSAAGSTGGPAATQTPRSSEVPTTGAATAPGTIAGPPGSAADRLLGADHLLVQVLTEPGAEPRRSTLDHVLGVLRDVASGDVATAGGTVDGSHDIWSSDDVRAAARAKVVHVAADTAVLQLLFVHGRHEDGDDVLGVAVSAGAAAVFSDQVATAATPLVAGGRIEQAVTTHEVGHLLGLVDLYLHTGRADPDQPGHSTNRRSVMYWAVESSLVADLLEGGPPVDFDDRDLADLAAIRRG